MKRAFKFIIISGIGFIIDFIIYNILTIIFKINVDISNMISSLCGVTFVFFKSTKKVFINNNTNLKLKYKYLIYVIYQIILIYTASKCLLVLENLIIKTDINLFINYAKIIVKILITPVTLTINYFVMKYLTKL